MPPRVQGIEDISKPLQKSRLNKKGLCDYVVNVASGCLHGCTFCYVPSTPVIRTNQESLRSKGVNDPQMDWGNYLFVRESLPEKLEEQISRKRKWTISNSGQGVTLLCSGTDPYQNRRVSSISRQSIQILSNHKKRVRVLTRSPLWVSDLDILTNPQITIGMSIPHLEDDLSRQIEPYAPLPSDRYKALRQGQASGCRIFVAMAPTPPVLSRHQIHVTLSNILAIEPEVIFWEPINARGSNGRRMRSAGLAWVESVSDKQTWATDFLRQWDLVEDVASQLGCLERLHVWPDPELKKYTTDHSRIDKWLYRQTCEHWGEL